LPNRKIVGEELDKLRKKTKKEIENFKGDEISENYISDILKKNLNEYIELKKYIEDIKNEFK
jgi:flagellar biosynthesis component FlhA